MSARRCSWLWPVALVVVLALVLPTAAAANGTYVSHAGSFVTGITGGTNGFRLQLWETGRRHFKLVVKGHDSKTTYETEGGPVAAGRVSARLGARGGVDLRFVPVGRPRAIQPPSWCEGPPSHWQPGYLVGRLAFHGERGYTRARRHRLHAARDTWPPLRCHYASGPEYHPDKEARARVGSWSFQHRALSFGAALFHRDARPRARRVEFRASDYDRSGPVTIDHQVEVAAPEADVDFPDGPVSETATVSPPAPFSGSATFTRTHESTFTWTGDLSVTFPGIGPFRLAGPRFGARLCTAEGCISRNQEQDFGERGAGSR
jgi:hypothetical protein